MRAINTTGISLFGKSIVCVNGCLEWQGRRNIGGYGVVQFRKKQWPAHRVSWTLFRGEIPSGASHDFCVLHRCDNPPCINPNHLFLGSQRENVFDSIKKKRHYDIGKSERLATHCLRGHRLSGDNLHVLRNGARKCRACDALRHRMKRRQKCPQ